MFNLNNKVEPNYWIKFALKFFLSLFIDIQICVAHLVEYRNLIDPVSNPKTVTDFFPLHFVKAFSDFSLWQFSLVLVEFNDAFNTIRLCK